MNRYAARDLTDLNTLAVPATAAHFAAVNSVAEVQAACAWARERDLRVLVLGGGSNVIAAEQVAALVVKPEISGIEPVNISEQNIWIDVGAGENWHHLVTYCLDQGWYGLENLSLIPGSVGAAPVQNIGAYGVELSQVFDSLEAVHIGTGRVETFDLAQCAFGYRDSIFKNALRGQYLITRVRLRLSLVAEVNIRYPALAEVLADTGSEITPRQVSEAVCAIRRSKLPDPAVIPNAGSFFKNPVVDDNHYECLRQDYPGIVAFAVQGGKKLAAGWLIEQAGWKGRSHGGVHVHEHQALVLTNPQRCSADKVLSAAAAIQADVASLFGVTLELEPQLLG